jgi:hypothetical protein
MHGKMHGKSNRSVRKMTAAVALTLDTAPADEADEAAILRFLSGETDGQALLRAIYDGPMTEPVPARMLALLRSHQQQ